MLFRLLLDPSFSNDSASSTRVYISIINRHRLTVVLLCSLLDLHLSPKLPNPFPRRVLPPCHYIFFISPLPLLAQFPILGLQLRFPVFTLCPSTADPIRRNLDMFVSLITPKKNSRQLNIDLPCWTLSVLKARVVIKLQASLHPVVSRKFKESEALGLASRFVGAVSSRNRLNFCKMSFYRGISC